MKLVFDTSHGREPFAVQLEEYLRKRRDCVEMREVLSSCIGLNEQLLRRIEFLERRAESRVV